jgi:hypothetical protein
MFEALREQAESPTGDNLPPTPDHPKAKREVFDDSLGRKVVVYKARESFIKSMGRPARRVLAFHTGRGNAYFLPNGAEAAS